MKLTVQQVYDATLLIAQIIRDQSGIPRDDGSLHPRPMPQTGRYRLARLHAKLLTEFAPINEQRDRLIMAYDHHESSTDAAGAITISSQFSVPADKEAEFAAAWRKIAAQEIDVAVDPIPLAQLDLGGSADGSILANEFIVLGDLVAE